MTFILAILFSGITHAQSLCVAIPYPEVSAPEIQRIQQDPDTRIMTGSLEKIEECFTGHFKKIVLVLHSMTLDNENGALVAYSDHEKRLVFVSERYLRIQISKATEISKIGLLTCATESVVNAYRHSLLPLWNAGKLFVEPAEKDDGRSIRQLPELINRMH